MTKTEAILKNGDVLKDTSFKLVAFSLSLNP
jgi:hypothetical protein